MFYNHDTDSLREKIAVADSLREKIAPLGEKIA